MKSAGFSLIELLVATAVAGMMAAVLFAALFQINSSVIITDSVMGFNERAALFASIFEHDVAGATLLLDNEPPEKIEKEKPVGDTTDKDKTAQKPKAAGEEGDEKAPKKEKKIVTKIFESTVRGANLDMLTFTSNNALRAFWSTSPGLADIGKPKSRLARVTYTLEEDKSTPGSFRLMRQESAQLDWDRRAGRTYELVGGIKNLSLKFTAKIEKKIPVEEAVQEPAEGKDHGKPGMPAAKAPPKIKKTKTEISYKDMNTWIIEKKKQEGAKKESPEAAEVQKPLPVDVEAVLVLWDDEHKRDATYTFNFALDADTEHIKRRRRIPRMPSDVQGPSGGSRPPTGSRGPQNGSMMPPARPTGQAMNAHGLPANLPLGNNVRRIFEHAYAREVSRGTL